MLSKFFFCRFSCRIFRFSTASYDFRFNFSARSRSFFFCNSLIYVCLSSNFSHLRRSIYCLDRTLSRCLESDLIRLWISVRFSERLDSEKSLSVPTYLVSGSADRLLYELWYMLTGSSPMSRRSLSNVFLFAPIEVTKRDLFRSGMPLLLGVTFYVLDLSFRGGSPCSY